MEEREDAEEGRCEEVGHAGDDGGAKTGTRSRRGFTEQKTPLCGLRMLLRLKRLVRVLLCLINSGAKVRPGTRLLMRTRLVCFLIAQAFYQTLDCGLMSAFETWGVKVGLMQLM